MKLSSHNEERIDSLIVDGGCDILREAGYDVAKLFIIETGAALP